MKNDIVLVRPSLELKEKRDMQQKCYINFSRWLKKQK